MICLAIHQQPLALSLYKIFCAGFFHFKRGMIFINKEYAYIRVSSKDQQESRQVIAMENRGIPSERIFLEKLSGKDTKRPMLQSLMSTVKK